MNETMSEIVEDQQGFEGDLDCSRPVELLQTDGQARWWPNDAIVVVWLMIYRTWITLILCDVIAR